MQDEQSESRIRHVQRAALWGLRADNVAMWFAIGATVPYYLSHFPSPGADSSVLDFAVAAGMFVYGVGPWLFANPVHLLLFIPGFLVFLSKAHHPGPY